MSVIDGFVSFYSSVGEVLQQWDDFGIFMYVLPFLLIFALIFAILDRIEIFSERRGISAIIAIVVGILAIRLPFVSDFFNSIFPKLGVGLAVILVALILIGIFMPKGDDHKLGYIFTGLGALVFLVVIFSSFSDYAWWDSGWWQQYYGAIVIGVIVVLILIVVIASGGKASDSGGKKGKTGKFVEIRN